MIPILWILIGILAVVAIGTMAAVGISLTSKKGDKCIPGQMFDILTGKCTVAGKCNPPCAVGKVCNPQGKCCSSMCGLEGCCNENQQCGGTGERPQCVDCASPLCGNTCCSDGKCITESSGNKVCCGKGSTVCIDPITQIKSCCSAGTTCCFDPVNKTFNCCPSGQKCVDGKCVCDCGDGTTTQEPCNGVCFTTTDTTGKKSCVCQPPTGWQGSPLSSNPSIPNPNNPEAIACNDPSGRGYWCGSPGTGYTLTEKAIDPSLKGTVAQCQAKLAEKGLLFGSFNEQTGECVGSMNCNPGMTNPSFPQCPGGGSTTGCPFPGVQASRCCADGTYCGEGLACTSDNQCCAQGQSVCNGSCCPINNCVNGVCLSGLDTIQDIWNAVQSYGNLCFVCFDWIKNSGNPVYMLTFSSTSTSMAPCVNVAGHLGPSKLNSHLPTEVRAASLNMTNTGSVFYLRPCKTSGEFLLVIGIGANANANCITYNNNIFLDTCSSCSDSQGRQTFSTAPGFNNSLFFNNEGYVYCSADGSIHISNTNTNSDDNLGYGLGTSGSNWHVMAYNSNAA